MRKAADHNVLYNADIAVSLQPAFEPHGDFAELRADSTCPVKHAFASATKDHDITSDAHSAIYSCYVTSTCARSCAIAIREYARPAGLFRFEHIKHRIEPAIGDAADRRGCPHDVRRASSVVRVHAKSALAVGDAAPRFDYRWQTTHRARACRSILP